MTLKTRIKSFLAREDGAMTTDFVMLTSGILGLGIILLASLAPQITDFSARSTQVEPDNRMIVQFATPQATSD